MSILARSSDRGYAGGNLGYTLALSAVTVVLVGCGSSATAGAQPSSSQQSGSQQPSAQASALGVTDSQTSAGSSRRRTSQLGVMPPNATGAAGTIELSFRLQNTSRQRCTIYGFVGMQMLDVAGRRPPTRVVRNGGFLSGQPGPNLVNLPPGDTATFQVLYGDVPVGSETCVQASRLLVTPPDETAGRSVAASFWAGMPDGRARRIAGAPALPHLTAGPALCERRRDRRRRAGRNAGASPRRGTLLNDSHCGLLPIPPVGRRYLSRQPAVVYSPPAVSGIAAAGL
jgi:Protein of unknown function (DUF4232)